MSGAPVVVNSAGQLGVAGSSERFKDNIRDMQDGSRDLYALRPVSFTYKSGIDPQGGAQFGLIAEEVEKVNPALVVHDRDGKIFTVRYEQVNAMLLNEFLREHAQVVAQAAELRALGESVRRTDAAIAAQARVITRQDGEFTAALAEVRELGAAVKAQATLLQQAGLETAQAAGTAGPLAVNDGR